MTLTGYLHPGYAQSLAEFGELVQLPRSGAWLLRRPIPGTGDFDALGTYPYLTAADWPALAADLEALGSSLVSIAAAPDPFGGFALDDLARAFPDRCVHFKDHHVADLSRPLEAIVSKRHRRRADKALQRVEVEIHERPVQLLDQWMGLFELSAARLRLTGLRALSRTSLAAQLDLPGAFMSIARYQGEIVSAHIQMLHGETAYAHLAAKNAIAYEVEADYALYLSEIEFYRDKARWMDWGGEVGLNRNGGGLGSFKQGWSTGVRPAFFGGRIGDPSRYGEIARAKAAGEADYFPSYRSGEFS